MRRNFIVPFFIVIFCCIGVIGASVVIPTSVSGQTADELQQQIDQHNASIQSLEAEIAKYQTELDKTSSQAKTLQGAVQTLDVSSKKLGADLSVTQNKIQATDLTITSLSNQISDKQKKITTSEQGLAEAIRSIDETDSQSLLETMLIYPNMSTFWDNLVTLDKFQSSLQDQINSLQGYKSGLEISKLSSEQQKTNLQSLKDQLADQQKVVEATKKQKNSLLSETKSQESAYKTLIAEKKAKEDAFNDELISIQSKLNLIKDPSTLPQANSTDLIWPTTKHIITQYFGNTEFAQAHAAVYNGSGHNGIDIGVPIGTPIKSAADGVVMGTGNTDLTCPNASYGQWVMVKHNNGLSTLYGHLSVIKAVTGQQVSAGDVIGYSGMTGYATGPHLHFTVYASAGVEIKSMASKGCSGKVYTMPIADLKAYLNPLNYLPQ